MRVIAVDLGATSGRVVVIKYKNGIIDTNIIHRFSSYLISEDNHLFWDLNLIYENVLYGIQKCLNLYNDIKSIGIDSFGCDYIKIENIEKGKARAYRDYSNLEYSKKLLLEHDYKDIYKISGIQNLPFNSIFQLYQDKLNGSVNKVLMIPDYLNYKLSGVLTSELTNLSTTSLLDAYTQEISDKLIKLINIENNPFFAIYKPGQKIGEYKYKDQIADVISVCSHDTASAVFATPLDEDSCYLSSGTWSLFGALLDKPLINELTYEYNFTNEIGYDGKIRFLKNIMGQFIVEEVKKEFEKRENRKISFEEITSEIRKIKNDVYIDVDYQDFQYPGEMSQKINQYLIKTGQHSLNTLYEFVLCVYESLAYKYKIVFDKLKRITNKSYKKLFVIGGANQSEVLNHLVANFLDVDVYIGESEGSTIGNALVQLISLKEISLKDKDLLLKKRIKNVIKRDKELNEINYKIGEINRVLGGF